MSSPTPTGCEVCGERTVSLRLGRSELSRCDDCGHLLRDLTAAPAHHRDAAYGGEPTLDAARLALTYRTLVADGVPRSVFEIGYGTGALLRRFLEAGSRAAGADPDQLRLAVDPLVRAEATLFPCAVEDVDPGVIRTDMVFGVHVLEHVVDPARTLTLATRLLEPGGTVHFLTPAGDWEGLRWFGDGWWMLEDPTHVRFFTEESLRRLALGAGLVDVEVRRPLLDSLVTDAASAVRAVRPRPRPRGALASRTTMALAAATAPLVVSARAIRPRMRPTLHLVARVPS